MKKLLIMYATYGTGHMSTANYIEEYFSNKGEYEILKVDVLDYSRKVFGEVTDVLYDDVLFKLPVVWDLLYRTFDNKVTGGIAAEFQASIINNKKLNKLVKDFNPDMVIATHFTAAFLVQKLRRSGEINCHMISVVTDYKAHQMWLEVADELDALIVNSPEEKSILVEKGFSSKIIKTFGIPVSSKYTKKLYNKNKLMSKFNLVGDKPIVLFYGGGGNGSTASLPYLSALIDTEVEADVFFVCGRSEELKEKAERIVRKKEAKNVHVLGFIDNGPEYMMVSDLVITKPGGITVTECLTFHKPMLLIKGNLGQERDNYRYLTRKGYAINATQLPKFKREYTMLCTNDKYLEKLTNNVKKVDKESSMKKLYDLVNDILK